MLNGKVQQNGFLSTRILSLKSAGRIRLMPPVAGSGTIEGMNYAACGWLWHKICCELTGK